MNRLSVTQTEKRKAYVTKTVHKLNRTTQQWHTSMCIMHTHWAGTLSTHPTQVRLKERELATDQDTCAMHAYAWSQLMKVIS